MKNVHHFSFYGEFAEVVHIMGLLSSQIVQNFFWKSACSLVHLVPSIIERVSSYYIFATYSSGDMTIEDIDTLVMSEVN